VSVDPYTGKPRPAVWRKIVPPAPPARTLRCDGCDAEMVVRCRDCLWNNPCRAHRTCPSCAARESWRPVVYRTRP